MKITIGSYSASFLKESVLSSLTAQQKKVLIIASIIFGIVAAVSLRETQAMLSTPGLSGSGKQMLTDNLQKKKTERDQTIKDLEEQVENIQRELKEFI